MAKYANKYANKIKICKYAEKWENMQNMQIKLICIILTSLVISHATGFNKPSITKYTLERFFSYPILKDQVQSQTTSQWQLNLA